MTHPEPITLMANYIGAVRFPDGHLRFFSFQGTSDSARRMLFGRPEEVTHEQDYLPSARSAPDEEPVDVMPYFAHGSADVLFCSRASRTLGLIVGPVSPDEALREAGADAGSPYGRSS